MKNTLTFMELIEQNKREIMKDEKTIEKIEKKLEFAQIKRQDEK